MVQGYLHKQGRRGYGWKKRWFALEDGNLVYYSDLTKTKQLGVLGSKFKVEDELNFVIIAGDRRMAVRAETHAEKRRWLEAFAGKRTTSSRNLNRSPGPASPSVQLLSSPLSLQGGEAYAPHVPAVCSTCGCHSNQTASSEGVTKTSRSDQQTPQASGAFPHGFPL